MSITTGLHRSITVNSRFYRFDLYAYMVLLILVGISNYVLIPPLGVTGAAVANAGSMFLYKLDGMLYVYRCFRIHPFTAKTPWAYILHGLLQATCIKR